MATITRRESGLWQAKVRTKGYPAQSKTFFKKTDAEAWAKQIELEMQRGAFRSYVRAERTVFDEVATRFENEYAPAHYRGQAWKHKLSHLRGFFGTYALSAITPELIARYRDTRLTAPDPRYKDPETAPRVSGATVKTEIDLLSKVLDVANKEFGIALPENPTKGIRKPRDNQARDRRLTAEEWKKLIAECRARKNPYLLAAVTLAVETAMRRGEILSARWEYLDLKSQVLHLPLTKNGEARAVPLSSRAIEIIKTLPRSLSGKIMPLEAQTLHSAFKAACSRAGLDDYRFHDLRHEALSRLAERGDLSMLELAAVSGHKTLQMLRRYTHLRAADLARKLG